MGNIANSQKIVSWLRSMADCIESEDPLIKDVIIEPVVMDFEKEEFARVMTFIFTSSPQKQAKPGEQ
ncbi:Uncharacterised protein [Cedecea neteri]|uniref:Uncharacterized protein n=1 Tax=Cedecea neteri TaxID=158822 RepID=A0A291E3S8_9ENTR|nr:MULTISPECIES: hypothetical protein [Cedecea]ATF94549.1 hypothetical protein CO704_21870 [Cedecea neteri]SMG61699.1 hypothetical protein SAMN03159353_105315 [Cedecea sp. NFIX57]SQA98000.1 Uncharacterised protein [Cedecea neteri]